MHSSLIGKVEKANRYARELDRISLERVALTFRGDNDTHHVSLDAGQWHCTCHYFESWGSCVHLLALQKIFGVMLPEEAQVSIFNATAAGATRLTQPPAPGTRRYRSPIERRRRIAPAASVRPYGTDVDPPVPRRLAPGAEPGIDLETPRAGGGGCGNRDARSRALVRRRTAFRHRLRSPWPTWRSSAGPESPGRIRRRTAPGR